MRSTFAITSVALFMFALDRLVVTTALPAIEADLGGGVAALAWTVNAFTLMALGAGASCLFAPVQATLATAPGLAVALCELGGVLGVAVVAGAGALMTFVLPAPHPQGAPA